MKWPTLSVEGAIIAILGVMCALIVLLLAYGKFPGETSTTMSNIVTAIVSGMVGYLGKSLKPETP